MVQCFRGGGATLKTKLKNLLTLWGKNHIAGELSNGEWRIEDGELGSHIRHCERLQGAWQSKIKFLDCFTRKGFAMTKGFTLAEILITLSILGVVAVLVVPNVVQTYKKIMVETRFRQTYSILNNAFDYIESVDRKQVGFTNSSSISNARRNFENLISTVVIPQLPVIEYVSHYELISGRSLFYKNLNNNHLKCMNGSNCYDIKNMSTVKLKNGAVIGFTPFTNAQMSGNSGFIMVVDIDGQDKGRNQIGYDIFSFVYLPSGTAFCETRGWSSKYCNHGGFMAGSHYYEYINKYKNATGDTDKDCDNISQKGKTCSIRIYENGFKIPKDYPVKNF